MNKPLIKIFNKIPESSNQDIGIEAILMLTKSEINLFNLNALENSA